MRVGCGPELARHLAYGTVRAPNMHNKQELILRGQ